MRRLGFLLALMVSGCMVGPDYHRPDAPVPVAYKELQGWTIAQPQDVADRGAWWSTYNDPELDRLERQIDVSNQTIKQFEAQYRDAVALVQEVRSNLFPTIGATAGATRSGTGKSPAQTQYSVEGLFSWDLDVWGRIRREVESQAAGAQVSAADLANARLSAQSTLATDYFDLRAEDSLADLLQETVAAFERSLAIVQNQHAAGTVTSGDLATAQAQLEGARAQLVAVGVQRATLEHAIAVLTGHPPAELTIAPAPLATEVPIVPPGLPSTLLQRRPDIAAAERLMQEENALIGVAKAAYYPDITLSADAGFLSNSLSGLTHTANSVWSVGASASETLFDGGLRSAEVAASRALYDQSVANYRQVVLIAFQQVEDQLSSLRILEQESQAEAVAVAAAQHAVDVTLNEYRAGTVPYTSVVTEQEILLADQQTALAVQQSRLVASVALTAALGGGWDTNQLPELAALRAGHSGTPR